MSVNFAHTVTEAQDAAKRGARVRNGMIAAVVISVFISAAVWFLADVIPSKTGSPFEPVRELCRRIAETSVGRGILESTLLFPTIEGFHLMGIALSIGVLCWLDLRLLGVAFTTHPVSKVWKQVMPVAAVGFGLVFLTGGLLFWAEAITAYDSVHFWIKIVLLVLVGLNALLFESTSHARMASWQDASAVPFRARMAGVVSLVLWAAIIITGRTMAYTF